VTIKQSMQPGVLFYSRDSTPVQIARPIVLQQIII